MAQYLPLPDGSYIKLREGETPAAAWMRAQQQYPEAFGATPAAAGPKESTLLGEVVRGAKQLGSTTRTGIEALAAPEEAARAGVERGQRIAEEAGAGPSFAALRKVYEEQGLLPAVGELASQVPRAVAGQLPQLAVMAGGAKAGAMAGTAAAPLLGPAAPIAPVVGGVLGAGATLLPQFFGANVERQAAEQMERGEPVDIDRARAAAAAAGQAGIEAGGTALVLGKRVVKGILGVTDDAALATAKAREELVKAAARSRIGAAGRGAAVGLAEVPVEVAQAVIERAQAGLDVLSPEALSEYGENAYLAGLVGPTLGAATRVTEPGAAREKLAAEDRIKAAEEKRAARTAEQAEKAKPEYALKLETDYQAAVARMKELQAAVPKRPGKDALPEEKMAYEEAKAARDKHLKEVLQPLAAEYVPRKAEIAQLKERQRVEGLTPLEYQLEQTETAPIKGIKPGERAPVTVEDTEILPTIKEPAPEATYAQQQMDLAKQQDVGTFEAADFAQYLMQDPAMAQRLVETRTPIPGVSKKESDAILGGLKLQLQDRAKQAREATQAALQQRQADLAAQQQVEPADPLELWKASLEETEDQATEELLRPNFEAGLTPSGPATVTVAPGIKPIQRPEQLLKRLDELTATRDQAAADADTAFAAGNKELGVKKSQEREAAQTALNNLEQDEGTPRALLSLRKAQDTALMNAAQLIDDLRVGRTLGGPEAATASSTPQTLINQINKQRDAFITASVQEAAATRRLFAKGLTQDEAVQAANQIRDVFNEWVTRSMAQPVTDVNWVDRLVAEANARGAVAGKELRDAPWVQQMKQDFIRAQMTDALTKRLGRQRMEEIAKGTAELKGAETELPADTRRAIESKAAVDFDRLITAAQEKALAQSTDPRPLEERRFGSYRAATAVLQEQLKGIASTLKQVPREFRREEPLLKMQFPETEAAKVAEARGETAQTLEGELRRRRDYVSTLIEQAFQTRKVPGIAQTLLTRAQDFIPQAPRSFLDAAENIASRILRGQNVERSDLITMRDELRAASARPGEAEVVGERVGQRELFPAEERRSLAPGVERGSIGVIRETPERFANAPIVKRARAAAARAQELLEQIKTAWDAADVAKEKVRKKKLAKAEAAVEQQREEYRDAFNAALEKTKIAEITAKFQPQIDAVINQLALFGKARAKALRAKDKDVAKDFETIIEVERENLQNLRQQLADALKSPSKAVEPAEMRGEKQMRGFTQPYEIAAAADDWVRFERDALTKAEAKLARLQGADKAPQVKAVAEQRAAVKTAEDITQRARTGLGLPGIRVERQAVAAEIAALAERIPKIKDPGKKRKAEERLARLEMTRREAPEEIKPSGEVADERAARAAEERKAEREAAAARRKEKETERSQLEDRALTLASEIEDLRDARERARTPASKERIQGQIDERSKEVMLLQSQLETPDLTRTEKRKARKAQKTLYSSRGVTSEKALLTSIAQKLQDKKPLSAYEKRIWEGRLVKKSGVSAEGKKVLTAASEAQRKEREEAQRPVGTFGETLGVEDVLSSFNVGGKDIFFSRGVPKDGLTKAGVVAELEKALGQKGVLDAQNVLTVVGSVADLKKLGNKLPSKLKDRLDDIPDDAKGFVYKGQAFLIAENIGKGHSLGVLLHEVGAHIGFRNFFNTAQYNALVETVKRWSTSKADTLEARIGRAAMERVKAAKTPSSQVNDELLAYAVEEAFNAGVEPAGVKGGNAVQNWLRMLVDGFKKALEKFGLAPQELKVGDLVNMAYGAANLELRGTWHGTGKPFKEFDFKYMGSGEGAQVYGWGTYRAQAHGTAKFYQKQEAEKQIEQWQQNPKIKEWTQSLTENTTFNGRTLASERERLEKIIQGRNEAARQQATAELYVFETLTQRARENNFKYSPAAQAERILKKGELTGLDASTQQKAEKVIDAIMDGTLPVVIPYNPKGLSTEDGLYYKNAGPYDEGSDFDAWYRLEQAIATADKTVGRTDPAAFMKAIKAAYKTELAEAEKTYKDSKKYKGASDYWKKTFDEWRAIDIDALVYSPIPEPPVPAPKGAFARVMSVRPDDEYYILDFPLDRQSPAIQKAIVDLLDSDSVVDKDALRAVLDKDMSSSSRARAINSALRSTPPRTTLLLRGFGVAGYRYLDGPSRDKKIDKDSKFNYVDFFDKDEGPAIVGWDIDRVGPAEEILFSRNLPVASRVANQIVGEQKGWFQKIKDNLLGVGGRMQFVDMRYTLEEALRRGGVADDKALQAMYYVRAYDQRMHMVSQAYQSGAPVKREITRRDGEKEYIIESEPGANISEAARILTSKPVVKAAGSADAANKLVTLYMSAIRGKNVGFDKLNFGRTWAQTEIQRLDTELKNPKLDTTERTNLQKRRARLEERLDTLPTEQEILDAKAEIEADPVLKDAFDKVREIYNEYNRNLIEFAVQSGAISREEANKLLKNNDYIPYYRMRGGAAELVIGNETPIRIGNLKDNPDLRELLGGDEPIIDFLTSSMQNTAMLLDMSMRNLATKNAMFELRDVGLARITKSPKGGAPANTITFKRDGEEYYAVVDTDALGIDSELVVKSMAGIPTLVPGFIRAMGIPARYLRRLIVASPVYWAKSLFRDTTAATLTSGANIVPVLGALRQIGKTETLERRGVTGGQVFSGMPEDTQRILKEMQAGKISLTNGMAWFEAKSAQIDAITRQNQYNSYIEQGLSELEATMMAMESMNFSRRGLSPAVHWLNTMIPFFNSQIQGLDVLYRSFTGKMPLNEKLGIKRKLWLRGSMIFGMSMAYAAMMQDDEAYKNASPEDKYGNWFVRLPGVKEPLRLPIPFELGYVFKALPEALVNIMVNEKGGEEAFKALKHFATQMIPGASNYFLPQAIKPALEAAANYSIYTERDIESVQEQEKEPWRRYRDSTTEVAKDLGKLTNFSPVMMEYLVRGYTGSLGMALLQALSFTYPKGEVEKAPKRLSEMPVIGSLFQPNDARGIIDATFRRVKEIESAQKTYDDILKEGNLAAATEYAKRKAEELSLTSVAGNFREMIGELTAQAKEIQAARGLSGEQKRRLLDQIRQQQIRIATSARQIFDKSTRQAVLA